MSEPGHANAAETWPAVLCGGPADGRVLALPRHPGQHPPDHYRVVLPLTVRPYTPEPDPAELAELPTEPIGLYSLAYTLGRPSLDDRGHLRYTWRGEVPL